MSDAGTVVVVTRDGVLRELSERLLKGVCDVVFFSGVQSSIDFIYNCIPNLLVVDMEDYDGHSASVLNGLKADP